ncbi:MAG TPA: glycosyltransferase [Bryobacteraceae bacterium]|jgi:glycosyltransferase involved in cell wall biosynthesis/cellulose synthase/poly-beta-1,6-N-acetylglucosamine synthase-like glycosyltransferase
MIWLFAITAALIAYILVGWPLLLGLWARLFPRPIKKEFVPRTVTAIVAVNNGEKFLGGKLDSLLALDYPADKLDIIVVSDGSTDGTDALVGEYSARDARIQLLRLPRGGKCAALTAAFAKATGEVLLLTDVRQTLDRNCLRRLVACFADPKVGVASGRLRIVKGDSDGEQAVGLYWRFELWIRDRLSAIDSMFGATGPIYSIRRELAVAVPSDVLLDDMYLPLSAFFKGYRLISEWDAVAWDVPTSVDEEFVRKVRTLAGNYQLMKFYPRLLGPGNRMWLHYMSYKVGRLVLPYVLIVFAIACAFTPGWLPKASLAGLGLLLLLAALDGWLPFKRLTTTAKTFVTMMAAAALAVRVFFVDPRSLWVVTRPKKDWSGKSVKRIPVMLATHLLDAGGSERQVRQTAIALDPARFDVHLAFFRPDETRELELREAGIKTIHVPLYSYFSFGAIKSALQLRRYLRTNKIQLLHAFDNPSSTFAVPVARFASTPVALASQRSNRNLEEKRFLRLRHIADPFAHGFVVNATALEDHLVNDEGIARDHIRICPNGLDTARFSCEDRHRIPDLRDAPLVIGCVAAQRREKQIPFLVDAFAEMRRQRPGLKLLLVGSGTETEKIAARVAANALGDDCLMIPQTLDSAPYLRSIDIFVLASTSEGTSNAVMEAMACGCAVVASNVEGLRDLVKDGTTGLLFEFGNQADLVAKVLSLVDDPERRRTIAAESSSWVRSTMSIEASAARMTAIYDEYLIGKGVIKG